MSIKWKILLLIILFWHDLSLLIFYWFKYYLYQVISDIPVLKAKFLLIKMATIDSWNFMTDSRRVFLKGFYASVIMWLTHKKTQPIKNYFLWKNTNTAYYDIIVTYSVRTWSNLAKIFSWLPVWT